MTPVVFIHWGETNYLNIARRQSVKYNKATVAILPNTDFAYSMEVDRWFILRDFMKNSSIERCLYVDSDVLLYSNVDWHFRLCDIAFSGFHSGHTMFINNPMVLVDLCGYIEDNIHDTSLVEETRKRLPNNVFADSIGDMVLLNNFAEKYKTVYRFQDTSELGYDHNINTEGLPEMKDGIPYRNNQRLHSLHFQGGAKHMMKDYANV